MDGNIIEFSHAAIYKKINTEKVAVIEKNMLYLFIRFNTPLKATTVNSKTSVVLDEQGNIFKTKIAYNPKTNTIIIKPAKPYSNKMFYYLSLSKSIKSQGGNTLSESVKIKFKVVDNKIVQYSLVNGKGVLPHKLGGVRDQTKKIPTVLKPKKDFKQPKQIRKLRYKRLKLETIFVIISAIIIVYFFPQGIFEVLLFGINLFFLSIFKYLIKNLTKAVKSQALYNIGVKYFNSKNFADSIEYFENALEIDHKNFLAQEALDLSYEKLLDSYEKN